MFGAFEQFIREQKLGYEKTSWHGESIPEIIPLDLDRRENEEIKANCGSSESKAALERMAARRASRKS